MQKCDFVYSTSMKLFKTDQTGSSIVIMYVKWQNFEVSECNSDNFNEKNSTYLICKFYLFIVRKYVEGIY